MLVDQSRVWGKKSSEYAMVGIEKSGSLDGYVQNYTWRHAGKVTENPEVSST